MQALILGLAMVAAGYFALRAFTRANPAALAGRLRMIGGIALLAAALFMMARGGLGLALGLAAAGLWLLSGGDIVLPGMPGSSSRYHGGRRSQVKTDHLEMELDHDTGEMRGRVIKGFFAGRSIERLRPVELAHLWQDCRFTDPQSAQLVEAYLDRVHPSWREDMARAEDSGPKGPDGRMTRDEALEILGLAGEPSDEEVRRAHRELMLKLHPDRGGSTYLAAKVNEAKDVLLGAG